MEFSRGWGAKTHIIEISLRYGYITLRRDGALYWKWNPKLKTVPWYEHRIEGGEHLFWFGKMEMIYTPPTFNPRKVDVASVFSRT